MNNILSTEKQAVVIGALAEGNSIRSIERMTGIHRDTVMRLEVRVGEGCARGRNLHVLHRKGKFDRSHALQAARSP